MDSTRLGSHNAPMDLACWLRCPSVSWKRLSTAQPQRSFQLRRLQARQLEPCAMQAPLRLMCRFLTRTSPFAASLLFLPDTKPITNTSRGGRRARHPKTHYPTVFSIFLAAGCLPNHLLAHQTCGSARFEPPQFSVPKLLSVPVLPSRFCRF